MARVRIGDMLIKAGLIDELQLQSALAQQKQWGGRLGDILVDKGFLDEMMLWRGLSKQLGVPLVSIPAAPPVPEIIAQLPRDICEKHDIFPIRREDRVLTVATSDPNNVGALDDVAFRTGLKIKVVIAPAREIEWAIRHFHAGDATPCPPPRERFRAELAVDMQIMQPDQMLHRANNPSGEGAPARSSPPQPRYSTSTVPSPARTTQAPAEVTTWPPKSTPPQGPALATTEAQLREGTQLLKLLIDTCVRQGIFTREEYIDRLKRLG